MIAQMLVAATALAAFLLLSGSLAAVVVIGCALVGVSLLREHDAPASKATDDAVQRSRTVIGQLDDPGRA